MPPIKIYTDAPLHPEGVTPKTAAPAVEEQEAVPQPTRTTGTTTAAAQLDPSLPPPPQPGARPQPGPIPTSTTSTSSSNPPQPQPGAAAGYASITAIHSTTTTSQLPPPPQMSIPAPTTNQAPTHSTYIPPTSIYESGASALPVSPARTAGFGGGRARAPSLEHPPGYVQNPYAADGTAADRARFDVAAQEAIEEEGVVGSVKQWVQGAGETLSKLEDEAWKWAKGRG